MNEFRVPTAQVEVEVLGMDGRTLPGVIFMPVLSAVHAGSMRLEEWVNGPAMFFPFRPANEKVGVLLNKRQVLALMTAFAAASYDDEQQALVAEAPERRVSLEAGGHRFDGRLVIDMPLNQQRVLDYVNRPGAFLLLHRGDGRHCLIQKDCITRITEMHGA